MDGHGQLATPVQLCMHPSFGHSSLALLPALKIRVFWSSAYTTLVPLHQHT